MAYQELNDTQIIELSVDFIKHNQELPAEISSRLRTLGLLDILLAPIGGDDADVS